MDSIDLRCNYIHFRVWRSGSLWQPVAPCAARVGHLKVTLQTPIPILEAWRLGGLKVCWLASLLAGRLAKWGWRLKDEAGRWWAVT